LGAKPYLKFIEQRHGSLLPHGAAPFRTLAADVFLDAVERGDAGWRLFSDR
jgi:hypothetical protein